MTVSGTPSGSILTHAEAEGSSSLPNDGWEIVTNEGENCLEALMTNYSTPSESYRLDYSFEVPTGITTVYVFAEIDVNGSGSDDSF
ncbi:MAG: hypothetical protein GY839_17565, partial [candidate division Zixibacteria bacterium]|nr:hypothetical protein [candidate division Zixibacteria bacterium]